LYPPEEEEAFGTRNERRRILDGRTATRQWWKGVALRGVANAASPGALVVVVIVLKK